MMASAEAPLALRVTAATALAPYQYPKAPRLLRKKIDLPEPVTIEDATANNARIGVFAIESLAQRALARSTVPNNQSARAPSLPGRPRRWASARRSAFSVRAAAPAPRAAMLPLPRRAA